ncbi:MAG: biotin transporter BioY [Deltaproteobacteria bacterium]|jgi:biotin transport system substrate-specific component|nr:biotin transporter BioY [Deltaproteobacteria bacterium]
MRATTSPFTLKDTAGAARAALWAALIAAGAWLSIPLGPVPVTLQTFFVLLCGFTEGPRAWKAVALYVGAGLAGFPVFSGGVAGPALLFGPTAGFALSFPPAAALAGMGARAGGGFARLFAFGALATALIYAAGAIGICVNLSLSWGKSFLAVLPFVPGDAVKLAAAALCAAGPARRLLRAGTTLGPKSAAPQKTRDPEAGGAQEAPGPEHSSSSSSSSASAASASAAGSAGGLAEGDPANERRESQESPACLDGPPGPDGGAGPC